MNKLLSIIVPAYNIEPYIGRCLDSILAQTYEKIEVIVVDDGSSDKTGEILDIYSMKDHRIKVIHKENGGVSSARNVGLDNATGDYIGFVDGDDIVEEDMYETLINLMEKEEADIAHCGYQMVFPNRVDHYYNTKKKKIQNNEEGLKDLLSGEMIEPSLNNKLYKKQLFDGIRLDEKLKINEDLKINYQLFQKANKSIYYDVAKYLYMVRTSSATGMHSLIQKNKDTIAVFQYIFGDCDNEGLKSTIYNRYIYLLMMSCRTNINDAEYKEQIKCKLREEKRSEAYKKVKSKKMRLMVDGILYMPFVFKVIYWIYDKKTGVSKKYSVNE